MLWFWLLMRLVGAMPRLTSSSNNEGQCRRSRLPLPATPQHGIFIVRSRLSLQRVSRIYDWGRSSPHRLYKFMTYISSYRDIITLGDARLISSPYFSPTAFHKAAFHCLELDISSLLTYYICRRFWLYLCHTMSQVLRAMMPTMTRCL